ncbi:MAG TPA: hypothetical protein VLK28_01590 [Methylomirabilota bacterium]|nr:hypothetical protein [Methylomirabilota bacterium]
MSFACRSDRRCDHPLKDCSAVQGEYCPVCHHASSLPAPTRRSPSPGAPKQRPGLSAVLREIRRRRARRT